MQVNDSFGTGGTVLIEGSNDGTNYVTLTDGAGSALSFTAAGLKAITEAVKWIRPRVSAGTSVRADIYLFAVAGGGSL